MLALLKISNVKIADGLNAFVSTPMAINVVLLNLSNHPGTTSLINISSRGGQNASLSFHKSPLECSRILPVHRSLSFQTHMTCCRSPPEYPSVGVIKKIEGKLIPPASVIFIILYSDPISERAPLSRSGSGSLRGAKYYHPASNPLHSLFHSCRARAMH